MLSMLSLISDLTSFGAAGLMGAMWLCERRLSRNREEQLSDAHQRIRRDEQKLSHLTNVVDRNTSAIVRFLEHQKEQSEILKQLREEMHHVRLS